MYTLILRSAGTYTVKIDNAEVESGDLENDWDFLLPKKIQVMQCVIELKHNNPSNEKTMERVEEVLFRETTRYCIFWFLPL